MAASHRYAHPQSKRPSRNTQKNHGRRQSLLWFLSCRKIFRLLLPFRNPIICATLYFGGLSMSIYMVGHASASIIFTPFCSHSFSRLYYICFYVFVYCLSAVLWRKCDRLASSSPFLLLLRSSPPVEPGGLFSHQKIQINPHQTPF